MKEFVKNTLLVAAFGAFLYAGITIPQMIHSHNCTGCDWFWCEGGAK